MAYCYERSEETSLNRRSKFAELSNVSSLTLPSSSYQERLELEVLLFGRRKKLFNTTSEDLFDFSRSDDDFEELAKGFQPKNTKESNSWAPKLNSEWAKAREDMDESNLTEMSLLTDNRDALYVATVHLF